MQSRSCRYLPDTFLGSEGPTPFVQLRLNICLDRLVFAYNIAFSATLGASDLRKAPFACKSPAVSKSSGTIVPEVKYHCDNNTPERPRRICLGTGSPMVVADGRAWRGSWVRSQLAL